MTSSAAQKPAAGAEALGETATHTLWLRGVAAYAVPKGMTGVDPAAVDPDAAPEGVVVASDELELRAKLDVASAWANSRGQFDEREHQRQAGSYLRADSALGEAETEETAARQIVVRIEGEYISLDADEFETAVGRRYGWSDLKISAKNLVKRAVRGYSPTSAALESALVIGAEAPLDGVTFHSVRTEGSVPELIRTIRNYNLVRFDWTYYGVPHGVPVDWNSPELRALPGLIWGDDLRVVTDQIYKATGYEPQRRKVDPAARGLGPAEVTNLVPQLVTSISGYNVVNYEGWYYGIPQTLGPIDLTETDIIDYPGVIRDVSLDVVENEIIDRTRAPGAA